MMYKNICVDYHNLSFIITLTSWDIIHDEGYDEFIINDGYIDLDGKVEEIVDITSEDMDIIVQLTYDNYSLFEKVCAENLSLIYDIVKFLKPF